jgi:hypothetical protein
VLWFGVVNFLGERFEREKGAAEASAAPVES